jgi:hypothetical protein
MGKKLSLLKLLRKETDIFLFEKSKSWPPEKFVSFFNFSEVEIFHSKDFVDQNFL